MGNSSPSLRHLLKNLDLNTFLQEHWIGTHWLDHDAGHFTSMFATLPVFQSPRAIMDAVKNDKILVMPPALSGEGYGSGIEVNKKDALGFYGAGMTLWIKKAQTSIPLCDDFLQSVAEDLFLPANYMDVQIWISPPGKGTLPHYDSSEVLNLQLKGTKRWKIAPNHEIKYPIADSEIRPKDLTGNLTTLDMSPGSALFLPRGYWHTTQAIDESISITLFMYSPTWWMIFRELFSSHFQKKEHWRKPIAGFRSGTASFEEQRSEFKQTLSEMRDYFSDANIDTLVEHWGKRIESTHRVKNQVLRYEKEPEASMTFANNPDSNGRLVTVSIHAKDIEHEVDLPVEFHEILQWLVEQKSSFTVDGMIELILKLAPDQDGRTFKVYKDLKIPKVLDTFTEMGFLKSSPD